MFSKHPRDDGEEGMMAPEEMATAMTSSATVDVPAGCGNPAKTHPQIGTRAYGGDLPRDNAVLDDGSPKIVCPDDELLGAVGGTEPIVTGEQAVVQSIVDTSLEVQMTLVDLDERYKHSKKRNAVARRSLTLRRLRNRSDGDAMAIKKALLKVESVAYLENRVGKLEANAEQINTYMTEKDRRIVYLENIVENLDENAKQNNTDMKEKDRTIAELKKNQELQEERIRRLEKIVKFEMNS